MKRTLIVGVALALAPVFALAADDTKKGAATPSTSSSLSQNDQFQALDKNHDGYLSQDELKGHSSMPSFSTLDKDGDGKISAQEWADHQKGAAGAAGPAGTPGAAGSSMAPSTASPSSSPSTATKK
jgi:EF hand domain-containing protein